MNYYNIDMIVNSLLFEGTMEGIECTFEEMEHAEMVIQALQERRVNVSNCVAVLCFPDDWVKVVRWESLYK